MADIFSKEYWIFKLCCFSVIAIFIVSICFIEKWKNKKYWYCLTYAGYIIDEPSSNGQASIYVGFIKNQVTLVEINRNKKAAGVTSEAVLLSASYLGYMAKQEFDKQFKP